MEAADLRGNIGINMTMINTTMRRRLRMIGTMKILTSGARTAVTNSTKTTSRSRMRTMAKWTTTWTRQMIAITINIGIKTESNY